uniref:inorganic diphosphatase n=1 Tax=Trypanosoma congolense (strain IL3000) TaxID=1068625 RepID=G0UK39_TRYCI|nr:putative inorganic pyrophosphatase [Trypanosoma congolense IL3000]
MLRTTFVSWGAAAAAGLVLPKWAIKEVGMMGSHAWRMHFTETVLDGVVTRSAWHDLPLYPSVDKSIITFVCEIPQKTRAKLELLKEEPHNPIAQDVLKKEGRPLRFFSYGDIPFNYGFTPRTWENPTLQDEQTRCVGDGDPIDVVELSPVPLAVGSIRAVRILGLLGLIDQGETDWKVITEAVGAGEAVTYGHLSNVPQELKSTIVRWFREYKTTDGKKPNEFAFGGGLRGAEDALHVIEMGSSQYADLLSGVVHNPGYWLP